MILSSTPWRRGAWPLACALSACLVTPSALAQVPAEPSPVADAVPAGASPAASEPIAAPAAQPNSAPSSEPIAAPEGDAARYTTTVTATRIEKDVRSTGSTVTVITRQELERRGVKTIADALRTVAGIDVVQNGGIGTLTSVYVRGADAGQALVLLDGVIVNDPSSFSGGVDFGDLGTELVERIEVLRGPASSLYGSNAVGGVIRINSRKPQGPLAATLQAEAGSFQTFRTSAQLSGQAGAWTWSLAASHVTTQSIALALVPEDRTQTNPYRRTQLLGQLSGALHPAVTVGLTLGYRIGDLQLDDYQLGRPVYDPNFEQRTRQLLARAWVRASLFSDRWNQELGFGFTRNDLEQDNGVDFENPSSTSTAYVGRRWMLDWEHVVNVLPGNVALALLTLREETVQTRYLSSSQFGDFRSALGEQSLWTGSATLQDTQRLFDALDLRASLRLDQNGVFGSAWTTTFALAYAVPRTGTFLRASYGTAFTAPSLQQLRDPNYGNPALQPERSGSAEVGLEQELFAGVLRFGAAFFYTDIRALFGFDPQTFQSLNLGDARILGVEAFASVRFRRVRLRVDSTWMQPRDVASGEDLLRRPRHKVAGILEFGPVSGFSWAVRGTWVGARSDLDYAAPVPTRVQLDPYVLLSLSANWAATEHLTLSLRAENLLNQRFSEVLGYATPGLAVYGGLGVTL